MLIVQRGKAPYKDFWSLPGGHVQFGEELMAAARRELREETGVDAGPLTFVDYVEILPQRRDVEARHYVLAVFTGNWRAGEARPASDAADARWFVPEQLENMMITDYTPAMIAKAAKLKTP